MAQPKSKVSKVSPSQNGAFKDAVRRAHSTSAKISEFPVDTDDLDERELLQVLTEVRNGNFSVRMPFDKVGLSGKVYDMLNEIISLNERMMLEFTKAGNTIGKQGKLTQRIEVPHAKLTEH